MIDVVALVDLDDTLFQTLRKRPADVPEAALSTMAVDRAGAPLGFATPRQASFLRWLVQGARLVPVTARSLEALRRVKLSYAEAICAHGGLILDENGEPDAEWHAEMAAAGKRCVGTLERLADEARARAAATGVALHVRVLGERGTPLYLVLKSPTSEEAALHQVVDGLETPAGWRRHLNGNNVAYLPPHLGKAHAVERLLRTLRPRFPYAAFVGVGDSHTDADFMALCDFALTPCGSQLAGALFARVS